MDMSMARWTGLTWTRSPLSWMTALAVLASLAGWVRPVAAAPGHDGSHGAGADASSIPDLPPGRPLEAYRRLLGPLGRSGGLFDRGVRYSVWESARGAEKTIGPGLLACDPLLTSGLVYVPHVVVTVEESGPRRVVGILQLREVKDADSIPDFLKLSEARAALLEPAASSGWGQFERRFASLTGPKKRYTALSNRNDMQVWATSLAGGQVRSVIFHPVWPEGEKSAGLLQRIECLTTHEHLVLDDWDRTLASAPWKRPHR